MNPVDNIKKFFFATPAPIAKGTPSLKRYISEDAIVADLVATIKGSGPISQRSWLGIALGDIIKGHHTTGQAIRNEYHLWELDNPYSHAAAEPNEQGIIDHPLHPDQMSTRIMERVWGELHR